jgi:hypothetical protein
MMQELTFEVRQRRWILAYCPRDGEEVIGSSLDEVFVIPDGKASWWYCPACHGWHVMIASDELNNCHPFNNVGIIELEQDKESKSLTEKPHPVGATPPVTRDGLLTPTTKTTSLWDYFWPCSDQLGCSFN